MMTDEISALKTLRVGSFSLSVITLYIIVSGIANIILLHLLHGPLCTLQTLFFFSPYIAMIVGAYYVLKLSLGFLKLNTNACIKLGFIGGIFMIISLVIAALFPVFSIVSFHPIYKANAISNEQAAKIILTSLISTTALSIFLLLIGNVF